MEAPVIVQKLTETMTVYSLGREEMKKIITDGGANIKSAVEQSQLNWLWCLCHSIHLAVMDTFASSTEYLRDLVEKVKSIVSFYHKSNVACQNLKNIQKDDNEINGIRDIHYKLINSVSTRWNTMHDMLKRMILLYDNVNASLVQLNHSELCLRDNEIDLMSSICSILLPVSQLNKILEADLVPTAHLALPLGKETIELVRTWTPRNADDYYNFPFTDVVATSVNAFQTSLLANLRQRLATVVNDPFYKISAMCSPRFKEMRFCTRQEIDEIKGNVIRIMIRYDQRDNPQQLVQQLNSTDDIDDDLPWNRLTGNVYASTSTSSTNNARMTVEMRMRQELERYINSIIPNNHLTSKNPLEYWLENKYVFPHIYSVALEHLHVPMSSATSERTFSAMGRTITPLRNRLDPETASMLVFLNDHNDKW